MAIGSAISSKTRLGDVAFSPQIAPTSQVPANVEDMIGRRLPQAIGTIGQGTSEALRLSEAGRQSGIEALLPFLDLRALQERDALLGLSGSAAQEAAIGNIPVTEFDRMLQERQRKSTARGLQATGDLGGGAGIAELSALGANQQSQLIKNRLDQLSPLIQASRGISSSLSSIDEEELARQAQLLQAQGIQKANVRFGTTAPVLNSIQNRGELAGLRAVSSANQNSQLFNQLASVIPQAYGAYQNYRTNQNVNADLNTAFSNNPDIFG